MLIYVSFLIFKASAGCFSGFQAAWTLHKFGEMPLQLFGRQAGGNQLFVFIAGNGDKIGGDELGAQQIFSGAAAGARKALAEAVV